MAERSGKNDAVQIEIHEDMAIGLWEHLGYDVADDLSPDEMLDIMSAKINSGEISPEQLKAALDGAKKQKKG